MFPNIAICSPQFFFGSLILAPHTHVTQGGKERQIMEAGPIFRGADAGFFDVCGLMMSIQCKGSSLGLGCLFQLELQLNIE